MTFCLQMGFLNGAYVLEEFKEQKNVQFVTVYQPSIHAATLPLKNKKILLLGITPLN